MTEVKLRRYLVREEDTCDWGEFVIGMNGYFSVVSSYGNYAFRWTAFTEDFRRFLADLNPDYYLNKLSDGRPEEYYAEETLMLVKKEIAKNLKDGTFTKKKANKELELLEEHSELSHPENFAMWVSETSLDEPYNYAIYDISRELRAFGKKMWPLFVTALLKELEEEETQDSSLNG